MPILDGTEITKLEQMIDAFEEDPALGQTTLAVEASWSGDFETRVIPSAKIQGSGGECLYAEELLEVLAKCVTYDLLGHGDHQGISMREVRVRVEGDIDFAGSVGLEAPAAFTALRVRMDVDSGAPEAAIEKLAATVQRASIVGQSLGAVPQDFQIAKSQAVSS